MRRTLPALTAAAALVAGALAFAPTVDQPTLEATHEITMVGAGSQTVTGATPAGSNASDPLNGSSCDHADQGNPTATCETVFVTVVQPVEDLDPEGFEVAVGTITAELSPALQGADFDFSVFEADAEGTRGDEIASSGNFPGCATVCGPAAGTVGDACGPDGVDECAAFDVTTSGLRGTEHLLVEVYHYASAGTYDLGFTWDLDTAGIPAQDGTEGDTTAGPATTVEAVDVTGGFERAGDWNGGQNAEIGDAAGQDLLGASIALQDDTFVFTIQVTNLPAAGGTPEATRYGWSFAYNDLELELDGKFTNYTRGTCDPTAGTCPPPRDPGLAPFLLRGNCAADTSLPITLTLCEELANVSATFDAAAGTITVPIPASVLAPEGVAACDTITGIPSFIGQSVWSAPSAFITNTAMPYDDAFHIVPFVVPHADGTACGA